MPWMGVTVFGTAAGQPDTWPMTTSPMSRLPDAHRSFPSPTDRTDAIESRAKLWCSMLLQIVTGAGEYRNCRTTASMSGQLATLIHSPRH